MRSGTVLAMVAMGAGIPTVSARAATLQFGGFVDGHAGYGSNPFFTPNSRGGSALVGATVSGTATRTTARSRTQLTGRADVDGYFKHYGRTSNYSALLAHNQQLSEHFALSGDVGYENSINPPASYSTKAADLLPQGDLLTVGQRTRRIYGDGNLTWEPNEKNLFQAGINASHATFSGGNSSAYDTYGFGVGYLRTFSPRTKIGLQLAGSEVRSQRTGTSRSYQLGLQVIQQISAVWSFDGGIGLLSQRSGGVTFNTPSFNGSLCGKYPRLRVCLLGSRLAAASGLGGLRTDTQAGVRVNYDLSARSHVDASATYDVSQARGGTIPTQKYYDGSLSYGRTLTPRLTFGVTGRYQGRDYGSLAGLSGANGGTVHSYTATVDLIFKFGRS